MMLMSRHVGDMARVVHVHHPITACDRVATVHHGLSPTVSIEAENTFLPCRDART